MRGRRLIFNNDGGESAVEMKVPTQEEFLRQRTTSLAGTQVDTLCYCTRSSGFGVFTHFTKIGQVFTLKEGRYAGNQTGAMRAAGLDPLRLVVEFGKKNGIDVFWSFRMNDTHDGSRTDYGPLLFADNRLKQAHPDWLLGSAKKPLKHGAWSAVDYTQPEVRELAFRFVEEVATSYAVDGIELDFFRHPVYFPSTAAGKPTTQTECDLMTALVRRIRKRIGRLPLAVRVPDSTAYGKAIGLELERWLAEGLIDLLVPSSYFQLNDWSYSVALGKKYGVAVYPSLDECRIRDEAGKAARSTLNAYRGRAAEVWASGADGVYLFNFNDSASPLLHEAGDPRILAQRDQDYFASTRGSVNAAGGNYPIAPFQTIETLTPSSPKPLPPGKSVSARLLLGDIAALQPTLRLQLKGLPAQPLLPVQLNGHRLLLSPTHDGWWEAPLPARLLPPGENRVTLTLPSTATKNALWTDLMLTAPLKR